MKKAKGKVMQVQHSQGAARGRGRPKLSAEGSEQVTIRFPRHLLEEVEAIVAERGHVTDRVAIIRELVVEGLKAQKRWGK